jgi:predicted dehydrogenase
MNVCHVIDYIYFLTGLKASRVHGQYATLGSPAEVEDIISLSFEMSNRAVGAISASSILRGADQVEERVWGTNGTVIIDADGLQVYSTRPVEGLRPGKLHRLTRFPQASWTAEWVRRFVESLRSGGVPEISAREAWENLAFIQTAYKSRDLRQALDVPEYPVALTQS